MCGIAGYRRFETKRDATHWNARLARASEQMRLRGPDDKGFYTAPGLGLAHRRLSIIDPAGGQQPLIDPETGAVIVFNGEIYNFDELRATLGGANHPFRTHSDTEVLLRAFITWGPACLDRLLGMFAFAVYTPADGAMFLARDRLGVKPLFWSADRDGFCFASSPRALQSLLPRTPTLNPAAVSHYLSTIRVNLGSETLLREIQLLEPGHWMRVSASGDKVVQCYWTPPCTAEGEKPVRSMESAIGELRPLMQDALQKRLISDVPLGGFLSGGLDSTIIASLASELSGQKYHAYSVGYAQSGYNEWPFIDMAASAYGMRCRNIELDPRDYADQWEFLIRSHGWPLSTPNEVPIYMLSKALKEEYTVALSGEGADEVFGGYTIPYFAAYDFNRAARSRLDPANHSEIDQAILRGYGQDHLPDLTTQHFLLNSWLSAPEKSACLHPDALIEMDEDRKMENYYRNLYDRNAHATTLDRIMQVHLRVNLEGLLLRVDSSSMAASVETRVPFTDHRLIEFAFLLSDEQRLRWKSPEAEARCASMNVSEIVADNALESKVVLRQAFANRVPRAILDRPKVSFPVPVFDWMNSWMQPRIREIIAGSPLRSTLFRPEVMNAWLSEEIQIHPMKLWPIANLCLWHDTLQ